MFVVLDTKLLLFHVSDLWTPNHDWYMPADWGSSYHKKEQVRMLYNWFSYKNTTSKDRVYSKSFAITKEVNDSSWWRQTHKFIIYSRRILQVDKASNLCIDINYERNLQVNFYNCIKLWLDIRRKYTVPCRRSYQMGYFPKH